MPPSQTDRRGFLKQAAGGALLPCVLTGLADAAESPEARASERSDADRKPAAWSAYAYESRVWVRVNDQVFACYRAHPTQKYPYFYPLLGPRTNMPMTEEAGVPWPHHRSVLFGCDHVNGANFWQAGTDRGQVVSQGLEIADAGPEKVVIRDRCRWQVPEQPPMMQDERVFTFATAGDDTRTLDVDIIWKALQDVVVSKTNHSLFAVRAARDLTPDGGGQLINSSGLTGAARTFGQPAKWCAFQARRMGVTEAIVLMDHPGNPWSPCKWFTRDYGFMSPTPFQWLDESGWHLGAGKSVHLRYRIVVQSRPVENGQLAKLYEEFAR